MKEELIISSADPERRNDLEEEFICSYSSKLNDYMFKMTIASILLFITHPWVAFFWPPYYYLRRRTQ